MFKGIVCGAGSFQNEEEDDDHQMRPRSSTSGGHKIKNIINNKKSNKKNPYSNRGLDKLSNVVADLTERRQKIYNQMGPQDITMVRFGYSYSQDWKPIIVKLKEEDQIQQHDPTNTATPITTTITTTPSPPEEEGNDRKAKEKKGLMCLIQWREPCYYFPMLVVLILLCLAIYGKSFAIVCLCMWWYLGPIVNCREKNQRGWVKKKRDYVRRMASEKNMESGNIGLSSSPRSKSLGHGSTPRLVHHRSWG